MKINKVTLTGIDESLDNSYLEDLYGKYPFVEYGVLFSKSQKSFRYPSLDWIKNLSSKVPLAAHLCGEYARELMFMTDTSIPFEVWNKFDRFQINLELGLDDKGAAAKVLSKYSSKKFIFQYNDKNRDFINQMTFYEKHKNFDVLYDSSGGKGEAISEIGPPFFHVPSATNIYTGYAGGINESNAEAISKEIQAYIVISDEVYLDMESGLRTDDRWDKDKVENILSQLVPIVAGK